MPFTLHCPKCNRALSVPDSLAGKNGRCGACEHTFTMTPPQAFQAVPVFKPESPTPANELIVIQERSTGRQKNRKSKSWLPLSVAVASAGGLLVAGLLLSIGGDKSRPNQKPVAPSAVAQAKPKTSSDKSRISAGQQADPSSSPENNEATTSPQVDPPSRGRNDDPANARRDTGASPPDAAKKEKETAPSDTPTFDGFDPLVQTVLGPMSDFYGQRGFKEYEFGQPKAAIESLSPIVPVTRGMEGLYLPSSAWQINGTGMRLLFADDRLVALVRDYSGDSDDYLEKLKEVFGRAEKDSIEQFAVSQQNGREEVLRILYRFPNSIVVLKVIDAARSDGFSVRRNERIGLHVHDAAWARAELNKDIAYKRRLLTWFRDLVMRSDISDLRYDGFPEYPKAVQRVLAGLFGQEPVPLDEATFKGLGRGYVTYVDSDLLASSKAEASKTRAAAKPFCFVSKLPLDTSKPFAPLPNGGINFALNFDVAPEPQKSLLLETQLSREVFRCTSLLVQEYFPPASETITTVTRGATKWFEWRCRGDLRVKVDGNVLTVVRNSAEL